MGPSSCGKKKKMKDGGKVMNEGMKALKEKAPEVAKKMGYKKGGSCGSKMKMKKGGMVKRDGCAVRGKTKGRMV